MTKIIAMIYSQISWYNGGGDGGVYEPVLRKVCAPSVALGHMHNLSYLWEKEENHTDMDEEYKDWKYTDHYSLKLYAEKVIVLPGRRILTGEIFIFEKEGLCGDIFHLPGKKLQKRNFIRPPWGGDET